MISECLSRAKSLLTNKGFFWFIYFNFNPQLWFESAEIKNFTNFVRKQTITYQPIVLPRKIIFPKRSDDTIVDSRSKVKKLNLRSSYRNKTVLDIGCAEGFFLIDAAKRGAAKVVGIDQLKSRIEIAERVVKIWKKSDLISVKRLQYQKLPKNQIFDIIYCFSVVHHQHGEVNGKNFADTWQVLTNTKYKKNYKNMISAVKKIASHTKEVTYWEYPFTYKGYKTKPRDVDFQLLGKKWVKEGIYRKVDFLGFSFRSNIKDRPLYKAYKHDYIREDKGFYIDFNRKSVKISFTLSASVYTEKQKLDSFNNVLSSFIYFRKIKWPWAPKLINFNKQDRFVEVERIDGKSLLELIIENKFSDVSNFKKQFTKLDQALYQAKINYQSGTIKDLILSNGGNLYLLDFEKCRPNQKYEGYLITELITDYLKRILTRKIPINNSSLKIGYALANLKISKIVL